jgi:uncharacterized membrane protein
MNMEQLRGLPAYQAYMKEVLAQLKSLPPPLQQEIIRELNSHIYESLEHGQDQEAPAMVLQRLGNPADYLPEWVAQKKLEKATQSYHPLRIMGALVRAMRQGVNLIQYALFGLLYLFSFAFAFLFLAKLIAPRHTGLFHYPNGSLTFGFSSAAAAGVQEMAGWWFLPICAFISIFLYVLITALLKVSAFKRG